MFAQDLEHAAETVLRETRQLHMGIARLLRLDAPIVACVHGAAMGGAVAVVANCDVVVAADSAKFGAAYSHIGFTCDLGASTGLAARMGLARARRYLLLGETLDARAACEAGLADEVVDDGQVMAAAESRARMLSIGPTRVYGEVRRLLAHAWSRPFEALQEDEAQALATIAGTADAQEGIRAAKDGRVPRFLGR
jgi:2-(1,2-epoxy-1,2-dihydrophenyl)acetyl-CoA isomerase